jgi:hypothetical protein
MEQVNNFDVARFKLEPDFRVIGKYVNLGKSDKEVNAFIKLYKRTGAVIELPFIPISEEESLSEGLVAIINKYSLQEHGVNISYILLTLLKHTYPRLTEVSIPASKNYELVAEFEGFINYLLANESRRLKLHIETLPNADESLKRHKSKGKVFEKKSITLDNDELTSWLRRVVVDAADKGQYPIKWAQQLFGSKIVSTERRKWFKTHRSMHIESASIDSLRTDVIAEFCAPIINYLQVETNIKRGKAKHWSYPQLSFLIELLILVGYLKSSNPDFKLGYTSPTNTDKRYLDSTLNNKLNKGTILIMNPIRA